MKVGIITMHRVINFGSVLQAYALQQKIKQLNHDVEIVDYIYPNKEHYVHLSPLKRMINQMTRFIKNAVIGFPDLRKKRRFSQFWKKDLNLSRNQYELREEIIATPPEYDLYMTGSDQVWNTKFTKHDDTFLLAFVNERTKKKVSFASSFALDHIPEMYQYLFKKNLPLYDRISVREASGIRMAKEMGGVDAELVCDPTLLLKKEDWMSFSRNAHKYADEPYILVYLLAYSFNPFPDVDHIVNTAQRKLGKKIIFLEGGKRDCFKPNSQIIKDAGPKEFVDLFLYADFVITTSFHGTAFSLNFNKPFLAIIKDGNSDSRIISLLNLVNETERAIAYNEKIVPVNMSLRKDTQQKLEKFRDKSISYLTDCLNM